MPDLPTSLRTATKSTACCTPAAILEKAKDIFAEAIKHRPRIRLTIRQRMRVLQQWPPIGTIPAQEEG